MNLSASAVMASHLSKTQVNNYLNHSPTRSQYSGSGEIARDISTKASPQYTSSSQRYSPEVEGLRREINDQIRNYFYSLSSDINVLKKDNSENKGHMEELRRELDSMNSKVAQLRVNSDNSELQLRESYSSKENKSAKIDNWMRNDNNLGDINERIYQISRQIHTLNSEMETLKKPNYVSKEQFSRTMGDVIDELERKLQIINERVRERIEEMDISLVRSQNEKEKDFNRLYFDMKNMQSSLVKTNDQVNTFAQNNEANVEEHVKKMMNSFSNDFKNLSTTPSSAEHKYKSSKKDEHHSILGSSTYHNKEVEVKLRELDSISQTIGLLEKEMRAKTDMIDLNINSIKRNLELELSIQLKHMVLPIQKNLEQYLQSTESRFSALEDAVLNHMKRDSYIMTAERASRLRGSGSLDLRGSNFDENIQFAPKPGFNNISVIDSHVENRQDKRTSQPESRVGSGMKDRGRERDRHVNDAFRIEEVDSVLSMNETLQSTTKNEGRYDNKHDQRFTPPPYQDTLEAEEESEEEEAPATNTAKEILSDKDRNKKQKNAADFFKDLETKPLPETMFRDFPSTSAMKSALEMEHPDNKVQDRASSAKKKKPEIDVSETHKNVLRDAPKKPGNSPFNKLSLATNAYMDDEEEEEQAPPLRKNDVAAKGREAPDHFNDDVDEFQGNIKGLLRKSRNKKENNFQEEEERPASKQKGASQKAPQYEPEVPKYGKEPVADAFKKNPLPKKDFEKKNALEKQAQKELPPVDTKAMKNFNKGGNLAPPKGPQGKGLNQPGNMPQNMGYQRGYDGGNQWQGEEDDGESVEEIVYNVDEEGFLVDEQGNYLVDEQGNFLQLSPEQMREIEERDLVYEKEF